MKKYILLGFGCFFSFFDFAEAENYDDYFLNSDQIKISNKDVFFTHSRSEWVRTPVREQNQKAKIQRQKSAENLKFSAPKDSNPSASKINPDKSYFDFFKQEIEKSADEKAQQIEQIPEPEKLQMGIKNIAFSGMKLKNWNRIRDNEGGFRVQNTLKNFQKKQKSLSKKIPGTLRKSEGYHRGKFQLFQGEIAGFGVQR